MRLAVCLAMAACALPAHAADAPPLKIPLEPMGYQTLQTNFLLAGSSMMTVHFVDNGHLLITFAVRRLMKRDEVGDPDDPDHLDRTIGAYLVELPTRKVLASTEWRVHDHGQYLWSVGEGRFLLRIQDRLTMFAPLANPGDEFHQYPMLQVQLHILGILVSAENDLLTIESAERPPPAGVASDVHIVGEAPRPPSVQINFYRLAPGMPGSGPLVRVAGVLRAKTPLALPVTSEGFIDIAQDGRDHWMLDFDTHAGKVSQMPYFDSTCFPRATFVSRSEFVVFGCRGVSEKSDIAGFTVAGDEMWQQNFFETHMFPWFAFAPAAGRFALGRMIVDSLAADPTSPSFSSQAQSEDVRVFQTHTGKMLLHVECSPIQRAGQNFALSPDGMKLAVIRETGGKRSLVTAGSDPVARTAAVEVYTLPALSKSDEAAIKAARAADPPASEAMIEMSAHPVPLPQQPAVAAGGAATLPEATGKVADAVVPKGEAMAPTVPVEKPPAAEAQPTALGDVPDDGPRKPPTLYGPGEGGAPK